MPVTKFTASTAALDDEPVLVSEETGELTLEAQVITDFLTDVDFSACWDVPGAEAHAVTAAFVEEKGADPSPRDVLPGFVVAATVDEDDLWGMFVDYLGLLHDRAEESDSLQDKARLAPFDDILSEGPNKKGHMRKSQKGGPKKRNNVVRQMLAMVHKGVLVRDGEGGYKKGKGYKKGGTPAGQNKVAKYKKASAGKVKKAAMKAGAAESFNVDNLNDYAVWGLGFPVDGFLFSAAVAEDAERELARVVEKYGHKGMPKGKAGHKGKGKSGGKMSDMSYEDDPEESTGFRSPRPSSVKEALDTERRGGSRLAGAVMEKLSTRATSGVDPSKRDMLDERAG